MNIRWLGHSCFLFTAKNGFKLLTDPFDATVGYPVPAVHTDIVTVSHHHFDHGSVQVLPGKPRIFEKEGLHPVPELSLRGISTFHDQNQGAKRGPNTVFTFTMDGVRIIHLGDLGHLLTPAQLAEIGEVDIVCVPIGGVYTVDAGEAYEVVKQLNPKIILPMHYLLNDSIQVKVGKLEPFLTYFDQKQIKKKETLDISVASLPSEKEVIVLYLYTLTGIGS